MVLTTKELSTLPRDARAIFRRGEYTQQTSGVCPGYAQANLAIVPQSVAFDFLLFCQRNPKPCPVLEVLDPGDPRIKITARDADIRTDLPRYRVFVNGQVVDEPTDVKKWWRDDLVAFLLGCSHSFEDALVKASVPVWHLECDCPGAAYKTSIDCVPAGVFHGPLVVSVRPMPPEKAVRAVQVTSRYPFVHGAPVHIGDPALIGIKELSKPDYGTSPRVRLGEIPVFWGCGITPQAVAIAARVPFMITHYPTAMFITDIPSEQMAVL